MARVVSLFFKRQSSAGLPGKLELGWSSIRADFFGGWPRAKRSRGISASHVARVPRCSGSMAVNTRPHALADSGVDDSSAGFKTIVFLL